MSIKSKIYHELYELASLKDKHGCYAAFDKLCLQYGQWIKTGTSMPQLKDSVIYSRSSSTGDEEELPPLNDQIGMLLDQQICKLKANDLIGFYAFELMYMAAKTPENMAKKLQRLRMLMLQQGMSPDKKSIMSHKRHFIEELRKLVLEFCDLYRDRNHHYEA